jgi:hypothetical protein
MEAEGGAERFAGGVEAEVGGEGLLDALAEALDPLCWLRRSDSLGRCPLDTVAPACE